MIKKKTNTKKNKGKKILPLLPQALSSFRLCFHGREKKNFQTKAILYFHQLGLITNHPNNSTAGQVTLNLRSRRRPMNPPRIIQILPWNSSATVAARPPPLHGRYMGRLPRATDFWWWNTLVLEHFLMNCKSRFPNGQYSQAARGVPDGLELMLRGISRDMAALILQSCCCPEVQTNTQNMTCMPKTIHSCR